MSYFSVYVSNTLVLFSMQLNVYVLCFFVLVLLLLLLLLLLLPCVFYFVVSSVVMRFLYDCFCFIYAAF
jgi:hypothetical protein